MDNNGSKIVTVSRFGIGFEDEKGRYFTLFCDRPTEALSAMRLILPLERVTIRTVSMLDKDGNVLLTHEASDIDVERWIV